MDTDTMINFETELAAAAKAADRYRRSIARAEVALNDRDAKIREAYARGASLAVVGEATGLSRANVSRIINFKA